MREYFLAYHSMLEAMRKLSDAEVGRLFRGLLHYSMTEEQPDNLQGREELLFDVFSQQIDRERAKYQRKCATNRENVSKRYATTGNDRIRSNTNVYESYQYKDKEEEKDKDENENEEKNKSPLRKGAQSEIPPGFVDFWTVYPRKVSKQTAIRAWNKTGANDSEALADTIIADVNRRLKTEWSGKDMQYIPHPSTYLNQRRWEDETASTERTESAPKNYDFADEDWFV